jgi:hypothetical protein
MAELTIEECQAILEKHRDWLYLGTLVQLPDDGWRSPARIAAKELASALAAALIRNERIARARSRNQGFARLYRDKALAFKAEVAEWDRTFEQFQVDYNHTLFELCNEVGIPMESIENGHRVMYPPLARARKMAEQYKMQAELIARLGWKWTGTEWHKEKEGW